MNVILKKWLTIDTYVLFMFVKTKKLSKYKFENLNKWHNQKMVQSVQFNLGFNNDDCSSTRKLEIYS